MSRKPHWERPEVRQAYNAADREEIGELLQAHGLTHLGVLSRGNHLVICQEDMGEKIPRLRFTRIGEHTYHLGIADHRGRWESTPFTGTIAELFTMVTEKFNWLLTDI